MTVSAGRVGSSRARALAIMTAALSVLAGIGAAAAEPENTGSSPTQVSAWKQTSPGDYAWTGAANWTGAVPNARGAAANLNLGLPGRMTINLTGPVTLGQLSIGETNGKGESAGVTIGGNGPLVFEGASAGAPSCLVITQGKASGGDRVNLAAGIRLGGSSPLTVTIASPAGFGCAVGSVELGSNTLTLSGPRNYYDPGTGWKGVGWQIGRISGSGNLIQDGTGANIQGVSPGFTGTLTVNNGDCTIAGLLPAVSKYVISGAFEIKSKYPHGGSLTIGGANSEHLTALPAPVRLNPDATLVFGGGGYFIYPGQNFDEMAFVGKTRPVVIERIRQIQILCGLSEIKVGNGNEVSGSTTFMATDPVSALVRNQGAALMVGGDDISSKQGYWGSLGKAERLMFASGIAGHLKGAGGPPGSKNRSIIPWMTMGTLYHPTDGGFATYDSENGVHTLRKEEYDYTLAGPPDRNVLCGDLNLGANKAQTVNAIIFDRWGNSDIGPGSTLTVTSGAFKIAGSMGGGSIGATPGAAGTINFGPAEGVIWPIWVTPYGDTTIYSNIAGSGGLTKTGTSTVVLIAANTYTGKTCVAAGGLQVGDGKTTVSRLGDGDVEVANGATLYIKSKVTNAILDTATVTLCNAGTAFYGMMSLDVGVDETVGGLVLAGKPQPPGTYGSSASAATHKLDNYFAGTGILTVSGKTAGKP